jgi:hypothetical protein
MAQIFKIVVRCPVTSKEIDTGIRTSGREVLSSNVYQDGMVDCPHCGSFHALDGNSFLRIEAASATDSLWRPNP